MSSPEAAIEAAIEALAKRAEEEDVATYALKYAAAVNQLAEARAWMTHRSQPHGGSLALSD